MIQIMMFMMLISSMLSEMFILYILIFIFLMYMILKMSETDININKCPILYIKSLFSNNEKFDNKQDDNIIKQNNKDVNNIKQDNNIVLQDNKNITLDNKQDNTTTLQDKNIIPIDNIIIPDIVIDNLIENENIYNNKLSYEKINNLEEFEIEPEEELFNMKTKRDYDLYDTNLDLSKKNGSNIRNMLNNYM